MPSFARSLALLGLLLAACGSSARPERTPASAAPSGPADTRRPASQEDAGQQGHDDAGGSDAGYQAALLSGEDARDPCGDGSEALVANLRIEEVALYQTVKVPLVRRGGWVTHRSAPVVQGKRALVRVFVTPDSRFDGRQVRGVLTVQNGSHAKQLTDELAPLSASTDAVLESSFNFELPGEDLTADTKLSVALVEASCPEHPESTDEARFPVSGERALEASAVGPLRVVVIPIRLSNKLLPDIGKAQLARIRKTLLAQYPVPDVEISAGEVFDWSFGVRANSDGWTELLTALQERRTTDKAPDNTFYFGLVTPKSEFSDYCGLACILGIAFQTDVLSREHQVGLGVGYAEDSTYATVVHELGHAHGRQHAPCGEPTDEDPKYPLKDGATGTWGWDSRSSLLVEPTASDVMGYCRPAWLSDYTYRAIAERSAEANISEGPAEDKATRPWSSLLLYGNGSARWVRSTTRTRPQGHIEQATLLAADGSVLGTRQAVRVGFSHSDNSLVYLPDLPDSWAKLVLADRVLTRTSVLDALSHR